ncbi:MAG: DNA methyltransferase [Terrisporobacter sp.]
MDNYYFSMKYEESLSIKDKKSMGIYYTPQIIVTYILEEILSKHNIIENPQPKILDLSCGCGNFLLEAYDILYKMIDENMEKIKKKYGINYIKNINTHIIENCIYGVDIDKNAINIFKKGLNYKKKLNDNKEDEISIINTNISCEDGLKKEYSIKFDYIIGNPPYVGHKTLDKDYKKYLLREYKDVYKDKADLYFCFYKKALDLISEDGKIGYISPRYFIESPSGYNLRNYLFNCSNIEKIIDLSGANVFKNIGVSPVIIFFSKTNKNKEVKNIIKVYKNKTDKININKINKFIDLLKCEECEKISIKQKDLRKNWILVNKEVKDFFEKIENKCTYTLEDIVISFQGIISGCDKAFILKKDDERINNIEKDILKLWIKNKNISSYVIEESKHKIIYSNDIKNLEDYIYIKENCFLPYKEKLENRRECKLNIRKWYELQWGREKSLFERKKIMYPYKSAGNRFAIDYNNSYCSADVYSFYIKEEYIDEFSLEYLLGLLNSNIYDKYFKIMAKDMGNKIYDYYPNKVMKIKIFKDENYDEIEDLSKQIIHNKLNIQRLKKEKNLQDKEVTFNKEIYYLENESHFLENRISKLIKKSLNL